MNPRQSFFYSIYLKKQEGFLLPVALFIILVVGGAALLMSQQLTQSSRSSLFTIHTTQSLYAAEMGAQLGAHQLRFPNVDRQQMDSRCLALSINRDFTEDGINQCTIQVSCNCRYDNDTACNAGDINNYNGATGVNNSYYQLSSEATCGLGNFRARQQHILSVRYQ